MGTDVQIFKNEELGAIRTVLIDNEPWFVGKDVAEILGYQRTADAIRTHVDSEDKGVGEIQTPGGTQTMTVINESGLYSLILSSKLPNAKQFKRWVTSEVLPSIRKHGAYLTEQKVEEVLLNPDTIIKLATQLKQEREARMQAEALNEANRPKVEFANAVAGSDGTISMADLAKLLKQNGVRTGRDRLYNWMREHGYLMKHGVSRNTPTQRAMEAGGFKVRESAIVSPYGGTIIKKTTLVTGKGQAYFIKKLCHQ
ncbi:phage antirepressor [Allisonella histaminiformans]|uniref:phage antirepressor n=1 Tax=Allisonella histaminiformans TaxID=209880 RepID=UPI002942EFA7|nr:phage antirepressor [Allisonella histaminiformans]